MNLHFNTLDQETIQFIFKSNTLFMSLRSAPSSPEISPQSSPRPHRPNNDRLSILTKLVKKGEKKGLFVEKMPVRIYQVRTV